MYGTSETKTLYLKGEFRFRNSSQVAYWVLAAFLVTFLLPANTSCHLWNYG